MQAPMHAQTHMNVCKHAHKHTCTHTHAHTHTHTHTHIKDSRMQITHTRILHTSTNL